MRKYLTRGAVFFLLSALFAQIILSSPCTAYAQDDAADYTPAQLDQLVAPVALYPDPLLGEVLMASSYPYEVMEAAQWRDANPGISGDYLTAALEQQSWDPSVKSLTEFPQVLQMMSNNLDWTEKLGEAFLDDQPYVMEAVQQLRRQALRNGALVSGPQELVSDQDGYITIAPANPANVYVPYYNPVTVFSPWPYPAYAPYYFAAPQGITYVNNNGYFGYYRPIFVVRALWGWDRWDWHAHRIYLNQRHWKDFDRDQAFRDHDEWRFEPEHRHDVPYKNAALRARFENAPQGTLNPYRGYEERAPVAETKPVETRQPGTGWSEVRQRSETGELHEVRQPEMRQPEVKRPEMAQPVMKQPVMTSVARQPEMKQPEARTQPTPRVAPPLFESFEPRPAAGSPHMHGNVTPHPAPAAPAVKAPPPAPVVDKVPNGFQKDQTK